MATQTSFEDILNMPFEDIERPKPLPQGQYVCIVKDFRRDKSTQKGTEFVEYLLGIQEAYEDTVDQEELDEYLNGAPLTATEVRYTIWLTPKSAYRFADFVRHCKVKVEKGASTEQVVPTVVNSEVIATIKHQSSRDPITDEVRTYVNVVGTAPLED